MTHDNLPSVIPPELCGCHQQTPTVQWLSAKSHPNTLPPASGPIWKQIRVQETTFIPSFVNLAPVKWAYRWVSSCGHLFSTWLLHWNTIQMFRMSPSNLQPKATQQKCCRWWVIEMKSVGGGITTAASRLFRFLNSSPEITQMQCFSCKHESFQIKDTNK